MSVHYESDGPVAVVTIDRPEVANRWRSCTEVQHLARRESGSPTAAG